MRLCSKNRVSLVTGNEIAFSRFKICRTFIRCFRPTSLSTAADFQPPDSRGFLDSYYRPKGKTSYVIRYPQPPTPPDPRHVRLELDPLDPQFPDPSQLASSLSQLPPALPSPLRKVRPCLHLAFAPSTSRQICRRAGVLSPNGDNASSSSPPP